MSEQQLIALLNRALGNGNGKFEPLDVHSMTQPFFWDIQIRRNLTLMAGKEEILKKREKGEMGRVWFGTVGTTQNTVSPKITVFGERDTAWEIPPFTPRELLIAGLGLAPGDVKLNPDGTSPDPHGEPNPSVFWLSRWKNTLEADVLGIPGTIFGMMYTPSPPLDYSNGVEVRLKNTGNSNATINIALFAFQVFKKPGQ